MAFEWYDPKKHKNSLQRRIKHTLITGYEMDMTSHLMNDGHYMYVVYGSPNIHIEAEKFFTLCEEVRDLLEREIDLP